LTRHRRGRFVIAHPGNSAGARAAIEGGVDILAHTFPSGDPADDIRALARVRATLRGGLIIYRRTP
jgi:RNase P/RNase MRP subunit p30